MNTEQQKKRRSFRFEDLIDRLEDESRGSRSLLSMVQDAQKEQAIKRKASGSAR